ncbi:MAG: two-component regulator propeller domain-containing protein [Calditrichaceae bacterium]
MKLSKILSTVHQVCIIIIISILFLCNFSFSQNGIKFKRLSIEQGLSQSTVETIIQDQLGFMWFGTEDGLNRYDGYEFTIFKHDPDDSTSISNNDIWCLYEDHKGNIWVGTYSGGLNCYDPKTEVFRRYVHDPLDPLSISSNKIRAITEDIDGVLWVGTLNGGLNRFDPDKEQFKRIVNDPNDLNSLGSNNIRFVYPSSDNTLWIATSKGVSIYELHTGKYTHIRTKNNNTNSICSNNVRHIFKDHNDIFWISTAKGLSSFNVHTKQFVNYLHNPENPASISSNSVRKVYEDRQDRLWIATTRGGLNLFNRDEQKFHSYLHVQNDPYSLSNNSMRVICEDNSGLLWLGTFGGGINIYDPGVNRFRHYKHDPDNPNSLGDPIVWGISQGPDGDLWFATNADGLNRINRKTGKYTSYKHDDKSNSLSDNHIRTIYWDKAGVLWIGSRYTGIDLYDPIKNEYHNFRYDSGNLNSLGNNNVRFIYEDKFGNMWFCTWGGGLDHFNKETNTFTHFKNLPDDSNSLSDDNVISIFQDADGVYWVATSNGLNMLTFPEKSTRLTTSLLSQPNFTRIYHNPSDPKSISNSYVLSVYQSKNKDLWFGTMLGLTRLKKDDYPNPEFTRYFIKNGLPNDVVYGILEDSQGFLWLSTNNGLSRFNPQTETFKNYDIQDGLQSNEFNSGAYTKTREGSFIFGGVNGANEIYPDSLSDNPYIPPIVLTGFNIFDRPMKLPQAITATKEIMLSYKQNYFSFEFAALDFSTPARNRYAYMLMGLDKEWIHSGTRRFAGYTRLDGGKYLFRVKGTNGDGVWNETGTSIRIIITPPFWKTLWFKVLLVLMIASGITLIIIYRIRRLLKLKAIEQAAEEKMRSKVAADFHDELGNRITKISLFSEIIKNNFEENIDNALEYLDKINENARNLYNETRDFIWHLDPKKDTLADLVIRLKSFGEELFEGTDITFRFVNLIKDAEQIHLSMEWRQHILRIFKEGMHNSLKYSKCSDVKLIIKKDDNKIILELSDDGIGFDPSEIRESNGLINMRNRAQAIQARIDILSSPGEGTQIILTLIHPNG